MKCSPRLMVVLGADTAAYQRDLGKAAETSKTHFDSIASAAKATQPPRWLACLPWKRSRKASKRRPGIRRFYGAPFSPDRPDR